MTNKTQYQNYLLVEQAIHYIRQHSVQQPTLAEIAQAVNLSEFHLQRLFKTWAGVSPKKFLQFLTKEQALINLRASKNVLDCSHEVGLSGPGRLHDLMVTTIAMTPGEIKMRGAGVAIEYGFAQTRFGLALIAWTPRGLCHLMFEESKALALQALEDLWPLASLRHHPEHALAYAQVIFEPQPKVAGAHNAPIKLLLKGTNFQIKVWEALLKAPFASVISYSELADAIAQPKAQRAVGSAVAKNALAYLIPCHRVIRESGEFGNYRWGLNKKVAILAWETAQVQDTE